jgi:hypothetical protein
VALHQQQTGQLSRTRPLTVPLLKITRVPDEIDARALLRLCHRFVISVIASSFPSNKPRRYAEIFPGTCACLPQPGVVE